MPLDSGGAVGSMTLPENTRTVVPDALSAPKGETVIARRRAEARRALIPAPARLSSP